MQLELPLPPHYRFDAMIDAHGWPQLAPFRWDTAERTLSRVEQLVGGKVIRLEMRERGRTLVVEVEGPPLTIGEAREVERVVRWMVELDEDLEEFYSFCAGYEALRHIPERGLGPMLRSPTVWEDYVKTVCTTNTTWAQTRGMVARIVDAYGARMEGTGSSSFPPPQAVTLVSAEEFAVTVRAGYRSPYLYATAAESAAGRLDLEQLKRRAREVDTPTLMAELRQLRGIGPYAAAHLALLLGSYGYIPVDSWARGLVSRAFRGGDKVSDRDVHALFEHFGRWQALAFRCWAWPE